MASSNLLNRSWWTFLQRTSSLMTQFDVAAGVGPVAC